MILSVFALFIFGLSAIYSVELSHAASDFIFLRKQLIAAGIGLVIGVAAMSMHYMQWRNLARILYITGVILLILVLIFGTTVRGTTGWFVFGGFSFQPVEFMKLGLAAELARFFSKLGRPNIGWREIGISGFLTFIPTVLTMMQPDLGSAMLLVGMWMIFLLFAGVKMKHVAAFILATIIIGLFSWQLVLRDYQKERIAVFMNPGLDPLGAGYNITQAKIAIGSGKILGRGLGSGSQSQLRFLPESQTDFVFAVIAEELGFLGSMFIFLATALLLSRMLRLAYGSRDPFASYLVIAIFALFFAQIFLNIGVNLSLLPATGVALPFVSYGGSSLLISFLLIAIVQSVAIEYRPQGKNDHGILDMPITL